MDIRKKAKEAAPKLASKATSGLIMSFFDWVAARRPNGWLAKRRARKGTAAGQAFADAVGGVVGAAVERKVK